MQKPLSYFSDSSVGNISTARLVALLMFVIFFLPSCIASFMSNSLLLENAVDKYGFEKKLVRGGLFDLTTFQKIRDVNQPYNIYIEGDGASFTFKQVSSDPTPRDLMMLRLVIEDSRPNVIYIARPCQFTKLETQMHCQKIYWSDKRMSTEIIDSINEVIKKIAGDKSPINLIGFSGGGGVATLLAQQNKNVQSIITISGNLDHEAFNKFHRTRPMIGSLNPINIAKKINNIPQLHLAGGRDTIVRPFIAEDYVTASGNNKCVKYTIYPNATHTTGWHQPWKEIISKQLKCD